jgi:N-acetylmuramoyl-L-alanine amidase
MSKFPVHIDPGHGGADTGAEENGIVEANLNAELAERVRHNLAAAGFEVHVGPQHTHSGDKFPNHERVALANAENAVLLCMHENDGGGHYSRIEMMDNNPQSHTLAGFLKAEFETLLKGIVTEVQIITMHHGDRGSVLIEGARRSAVLLEPLFLDDPKHAAWLKVAVNREGLAKAITRAVVKLAA